MLKNDRRSVNMPVLTFQNNCCACSIFRSQHCNCKWRNLCKALRSFATKSQIDSGVIRVGLSDHDLVYAVRKHRRECFIPRYITVRDFRDTDWKKVEDDISTFDWAPVSKFSDTTFSLECFRIWFEIIIDRHSKIGTR